MSRHAGGHAIGSTPLGNCVAACLRIQCGRTWLAPAWQPTAANTGALLGHAFASCGRRRVEFETSTLNLGSRAALLRLAAAEAGVLRPHMIDEDGSNRDRVYSRILDGVWAAVGERLSARVASG